MTAGLSWGGLYVRNQQSDSQGDRQIGLDYLRGFVVVLVVLHHAVLAYCRFGHFDPRHYLWSSAPIVDPQRCVGFDIAVLFNDSYFMPLMFLLSGLFVGPSLRRKGRTAYLLDRLRRLGVPFALAVLTIIPLAYYPSYRMTGSEIGFGAFWMQTVFDGPWPSGPPWFVAVLLGFDVVAAAVVPLLLRCRVSFAGLAAASLVAFLPLLIGFGPSRWFAWGPFSVQASRVLFYAVYFFAGIAIGPAIRVQGRRPMLLAVALFALLLAVQVCRLRAPAVVPPVVWLVLYGVTVATVQRRRSPERCWRCSVGSGGGSRFWDMSQRECLRYLLAALSVRHLGPVCVAGVGRWGDPLPRRLACLPAHWG